MKTIGVIMNGVTGRMGTNQHLARSILAIREQGGVRLKDGSMLSPEPVLVGRDEKKLAALAKTYSVEKYTTDLDAALSDRANEIYFDSQTTVRRPEGVARAIAAGKAIYCEKPTATTTEEALNLYRLARKAGVKNGVVQDKLWLPGLLKLKYLIDTGYFGRILSVRGEFGYWVFDGYAQPCQRPSWNYKKEEGGGIMIDMFCHWRYVIDNIFGRSNPFRPSGPPISTSGSTRGGWNTPAQPRTRPTERSSLKTALYVSSTLPGRSGSGGTISSSSRWTAPRARQSPVSGIAASRTSL